MSRRDLFKNHESGKHINSETDPCTSSNCTDVHSEASSINFDTNSEASSINFDTNSEASSINFDTNSEASSINFDTNSEASSINFDTNSEASSINDPDIIDDAPALRRNVSVLGMRSVTNRLSKFDSLSIDTHVPLGFNPAPKQTIPTNANELSKAKRRVALMRWLSETPSPPPFQADSESSGGWQSQPSSPFAGIRPCDSARFSFIPEPPRPPSPATPETPSTPDTPNGIRYWQQNDNRLETPVAIVNPRVYTQWRDFVAPNTVPSPTLLLPTRKECITPTTMERRRSIPLVSEWSDSSSQYSESSEEEPIVESDIVLIENIDDINFDSSDEASILTSGRGDNAGGYDVSNERCASSLEFSESSSDDESTLSDILSQLSINDCTICLEPDCDIELPCGHNYHVKCIRLWAETQGTYWHTCPVCRKEFHMPSELMDLAEDRHHKAEMTRIREHWINALRRRSSNLLHRRRHTEPNLSNARRNQTRRRSSHRMCVIS
jgi:hypothetical protein